MKIPKVNFIKYLNLRTNWEPEDTEEDKLII